MCESLDKSGMAALMGWVGVFVWVRGFGDGFVVSVRDEKYKWFLPGVRL